MFTKMINIETNMVCMMAIMAAMLWLVRLVRCLNPWVTEYPLLSSPQLGPIPRPILPTLRLTLEPLQYYQRWEQYSTVSIGTTLILPIWQQCSTISIGSSAAAVANNAIINSVIWIVGENICLPKIFKGKNYTCVVLWQSH